ncbi:T9SS type A sorting domain-containing protein [Fodinibius salsisoli]|uniref:T9SS type A sorting domain-containing protein n=1 Tax=Fodinibius salsisoli TaxID=2820877 RepID=A0ABT3PLY9_9BACT|nr:T9SS type A sorting domain-containing protein [Fodinibius salsisoli]MCW9706969.1 T9SS type A sorting domain-containing protein [Fodinibius salsisoli]
MGRNELKNHTLMRFGSRRLSIALLLGICLPIVAQAQYAKIDQAYKEGKLSLDQKIVYQFNAIRHPQKLPTLYREGENAQPYKCGTPAFKDFYQNRSKLSAATIQQVESMTTAPRVNASESYESPSGAFRIDYEATGPNKVPSVDADNDDIPDYVEEVAAAADSSYRHQVQTLGYSDPLINEQPYRIEIINLESIYGQTIAPANSNTTYIQIENDFAEGFPSNEDPEGDAIGAIKVTVAHELKHAIQFAATGWSGETDLWAEMDATLMEEVVYDEVNDYYNYLADPASIFSAPGTSFYPGSYYHVSWALFFQERYGPEFWPDVWEIIRKDPSITMVEALSQQLGGREAFEEAYISSQLWHYASGPLRSANDFGFEERDHYPSAQSKSSDSFYSDDMKKPYPTNPQPLENFSATYYTIAPPPESSGTVGVEFASSSQTSSSTIGIIAFFNDGSVDSKTIIDTPQQSRTLETSWNWSDITNMGLVFANDQTQRTTEEATLQLGNLNYDSFTVYQNYPNPFRESTTIRFILDKASHIQFKIYDTSGRLVRTLIDEELTAGPYEESFNASNLASGIYFYQLISDQKVIVKKMTLIK